MDASNIGQDKQYKDATDAHDAEHGKYDDAVQKVPLEQRLPTVQMPQADDPRPFTLGPQTAGGR